MQLVRTGTSLETYTHKSTLPSMEYSTSRIRLPEPLEPPSRRISLSSQYKKHGPIVTPIRKPRAAATKKRSHIPKKHHAARNVEALAGSQMLGLSLPYSRSDMCISPLPASTSGIGSTTRTNTLPSNSLRAQEFEWSSEIDCRDQPAVHSSSEREPHPLPAWNQVAESEEVRQSNSTGSKSDDYLLFFESVISGSLPFYQLSKKTFISNGWNTQRSEATVSSANLFFIDVTQCLVRAIGIIYMLLWKETEG